MHPRKRQALGVRGGDSFVGKVAVMGLLERKTETRGSRMRTKVVPNVRKHQLHAEIGTALFLLILIFKAAI